MVHFQNDVFGLNAGVGGRPGRIDIIDYDTLGLVAKSQPCGLFCRQQLNLDTQLFAPAIGSTR